MGVESDVSEVECAKGVIERSMFFPDCALLPRGGRETKLKEKKQTYRHELCVTFRKCFEYC